MIGCRKKDPLMKEYADYLEQLVAKDHTNEMEFTGETSKWWMAKSAAAAGGNCLGLDKNQVASKYRVSIIPAEELGAKTTNNRPVLIEELLGDVDIRLSPTSAGIYIPDQEILKRTKYQWFARLSPSQVLESNTLVGKYILAKATGCSG
jgi:hypothetical protein